MKALLLIPFLLFVALAFGPLRVSLEAQQSPPAAKLGPPPDVVTARDSIKVLKAQNDAALSVIANSRALLAAHPEDAEQLNAIIQAKRHEIEVNTRAMEGMMQGLHAAVEKSSAAARAALHGPSVGTAQNAARVSAPAAVLFEHIDAETGARKEAFSLNVCAKPPAVPVNYAIVTSDANGAVVSVHVTWKQLGVVNGRARITVDMPIR